MAQGIYYDIDGRIGGPVTFLQLQLMASSGMLQPQHRVRKEESEQWFPARQVKGLFSAAEVAATAAPAGPIAAAEPAAEDDNPFGWAPPTEEEPSINSAFNFFEQGAAPTAAQPVPAPAKKQSKLAEAAPALVAEEPTPSKPAPRIDEPKLEPPAARNEPPTRTEPKSDEVGPIPTTVEVTGQPVELLDDESVRLIDGKAVFRLSRTWLLSSTKFADGTSRAVYLRLQRIDAGILDQRSGPRHAKGGPHSVLSFRAGNVEIALAFQGNDKPYRSFLEKVILLSNTGRGK